MKRYQIILADPPWNESGGGKIKRGADRHYPLMKTKEIMSLPVGNIADENCHLYLWATNNFLHDAFKVIEAWNFKFKTLITWVKSTLADDVEQTYKLQRVGLGQYYRGLTEHCLFATRGVIPYKVVNGKRQQGKTVVMAGRGKHSQKPEQLRKMIEQVSDREGFNKVELFARKVVDGWDVMGDAIDGIDIRERLSKFN